ncbi:AAA family ATPase [bacterium]|nr:AAA family ATPase [bacterium]
MSDSIRKLSDILGAGDELSPDTESTQIGVRVEDVPDEPSAPIVPLEDTQDDDASEGISAFGKETAAVTNQLVMEWEILGIFFKNPSRDLAMTLRDFGPSLVLYTSQCRGIIQVIFEMIITSKEIDFATVIEATEKQNALDGIGGQAGVETLVNSTFTSPDEFAIVVQRLKDYHTVRKIRSLMESGLSLLKQGKRDPQQIINMLKLDIERISQNASGDEPRTVAAILDDIHNKTLMGKMSGFKSFASGFDALDRTIKGLGQGELILIGGAQGVGKTIMALQMARNLACSGEVKVLYICFEHGEEYLLKRLIPMESVNPFGLTAFDLGLVEKDVLEGINKASEGKVGFTELLRSSERGKKVLDKIEEYKNELVLYKGNTFKTTLQAIRRMAIDMMHESGKQVALVVDYLQKVPVYPDPASENEKVTTITEGLKDIALTLEIPIIAIVAADKEGLKAKRLRLYHLRGSSSIDYEADIALILNDKSKIISKSNIAYNPSKIAEYNKWVICTVEKNRTGRKMVDLEFQKHFKFFCFDPRGRIVQEQLIEEKLFKE